VFAYVLMNNHYHILLHPPAPNYPGPCRVRQLGVRTNSPIGEIFGLTGSAFSRRVRVLKSKAVNYKSIRKNSSHKINNRDLTPIPCLLLGLPYHQFLFSEIIDQHEVYADTSVCYVTPHLTGIEHVAPKRPGGAAGLEGGLDPRLGLLQANLKFQTRQKTTI
jgi:hypothetical protein